MNDVIKNKVLEEIDRIPEDKLSDLYHFIHYFRLGLESAKAEHRAETTLRFAGCWEDMSDEMFSELTKEFESRRQQAFSQRRQDESSLD